jgi:hypothetical protein
MLTRTAGENARPRILNGSTVRSLGLSHRDYIYAHLLWIEQRHDLC